jgi:hypothetical protein
VTIKRDATNPTGGSITANGSALDSYNTTGTVSLSKTNYTDATSGIASNALTRAHATLSGNSCGGFTGSDAVTISGGNDSDTLVTGCYRYTLAGTDNAGNNATTQSAIVKVDTSPPSTPTLSFGTSGTGVFYPGSGSNIYFKPSASSISFTVTASSTDGDSGIASYNFPSVSAWTLGAGTSSRTYTYTSGGTTQTNRSLTTTNNAGGTSAAATFDVTADSTAPSVTGTAIADQNTTTGGSIHQGASYYVYANVSESGSGLNTVTANVSNITTGATAVALSTTGGPWTISGTSYGYRSALQTANGSLSQGSKSFTVTGTDNVANSGSLSGSVTVDNTAPTVTLTAPANNSFTNDTTPTFTGACSNGDGNVTVTVKQGGSTVQTLTPACSSGSYSVDATTLGQNTYTAQAAQTDAALNTGSSSTNTFTVDTTTPTVSSVSLNNNGGTAGRLDTGDTIVITFSEQMKVSSFCSAWSGDTTDQTINGSGAVTVTLTDGGAGNDSVTVSSTGCTFNFGSINLGATGYLTGGGSRTYNGGGSSKSTISWTASTHTLTIMIGNAGTGGTIGTVASSTATYNPSASITDSAGNGGIASKSTANVQQF